ARTARTHLRQHRQQTAFAYTHTVLHADTRGLHASISRVLACTATWMRARRECLHATRHGACATLTGIHARETRSHAGWGVHMRSELRACKVRCALFEPSAPAADSRFSLYILLFHSCSILLLTTYCFMLLWLSVVMEQQ